MDREELRIRAVELSYEIYELESPDVLMVLRNAKVLENYLVTGTVPKKLPDVEKD